MEHDIFKIICPICDSFVDVFIYYGKGEAKIYCPENAPLHIVSAAHEMSKKGKVQCFSCGMNIAIAVGHIVSIRPLSVQKLCDVTWNE